MRNAEGRYFETADLRKVADILGMDGETLADTVTGLNCDTYADNSCDVMAGWFCDCAVNGDYEGNGAGHWEHVFYAVHQTDSMDNEELWHRCLNIQNEDDAQVRQAWEEGNTGTLLGMLESSFYRSQLEQGLEAIYWDEDNDVTPDYDTMVKQYKKDNNL